MPKRAAVEKDRLEGDHCITIQIALSCAFGTKAEQAWCSRLEDILEDSLRQSASGFVDGTETGMGTWTLYIYGRRASTMWKFLEAPLVAAKCPEGSFATIRSGDSIFTKEVVVPLFGPHAGKKPQAVKLQPAQRSKREDDEPKPGDVYAFNFSEGGVGALVVARTDRAKHKNAYALVYAIGRRYNDQPPPRHVQQLDATQAVLLLRTPKSILKGKHTCFLGRLRGFTPEAWPHPPELQCTSKRNADQILEHFPQSVMWTDRSNLVQVVRTQSATSDSHLFPRITDALWFSTLTGLIHHAIRGKAKRFRAGNVTSEIIDAARLAKWRAAETQPLPRHDDSLWRAARAHEGQVVAFPFDECGFGVAILARIRRTIAEYHVFNIRLPELPSPSIMETLRPRDIVDVVHCFMRPQFAGQYTVLGNLSGFSRATWPASPSMSCRKRDTKTTFMRTSARDDGCLYPSQDVKRPKLTVDIFANKQMRGRYREIPASGDGTFLEDALSVSRRSVIDRKADSLLECTDTTFDLWREIDQLFIDRMKAAKARKRR
jgi:hypothetical protein